MSMWVRIEPDFAEHPKIVGLSDAAFRVHLKALCWCGKHETDGLLPAGAVPATGSSRKRAELISELLSAGLWEKAGAGYRIHDFLCYNPSKEQNEERRRELSEKRAVAGRKGAAKRWAGHSKTDGKPNGNTDGNCQSEPVANGGKGLATRWPVSVSGSERDPDLSQPAKDLTGKSPPADAERARGPASEARARGPASSKPPVEPVRVAGGTRPRGVRPQVVPQELPTRVSPRDIAVPIEFLVYAVELGLTEQAFKDLVVDWREKVQPSTFTRLFDVLCRFIETAGARREKAAKAAASAPDATVDTPPPAWKPPPAPPPDPNPPPPNPLRAVRKASNG